MESWSVAPPQSTILVLEDDRALAELVCIYLEGAGYQVLTAHNVDHGIRLATAHPECVEMLLTDVSVPGATATKVSALFAALGRPTRCLYMSGRPRAMIPAQDLLIPGADLLEKPFSEIQLVEKVRQTLATAAPTAP